MLSAVLAEGTTTIDNAAKEPHVVDVANFLNTMGADIRGAGTDIIKINSILFNIEKRHKMYGIEKVEDNIISLAHYGEQNGDLMADPEMTFLIKDGSVFPMTFRNDYVGVNWEHIWIEEDGTIKFEKNGPDGAIEFSEIWLNNIKEQQNL